MRLGHSTDLRDSKVPYHWLPRPFKVRVLSQVLRPEDTTKEQSAATLSTKG